MDAMLLENGTIDELLSLQVFKKLSQKTQAVLRQSFRAQPYNLLKDGALDQLDITARQRQILEKAIQECQSQWTHSATLKLHKRFVNAGLDVSHKITDKIVKRLGKRIFEKLDANPYILLRFKALPFARVDQFAMAEGIDPQSPIRLKYGLLHAASEAIQRKGNTWIPTQHLVNDASRLLQLDASHINHQLTDDNITTFLTFIGQDRKRVTTSFIHSYETGIARHIQRLNHQGHNRPHEGSLITRPGIKLDKTQEKAAKAMITAHFFLLTGGPGTGKTTLVDTAVQTWLKNHLDCTAKDDILCLAPTGKAARRLGEVTGIPAKTIHSGLGCQLETPDEWLRNASNPLPQKLVIIDECSMIDVETGYRLFDAIDDGTQVWMIGDADQLPSVGPGKVFSDILESQAVASTRLKKIYRTGEGSGIARVARQIRDAQPVSSALIQEAPDIVTAKAIDAVSIRTRLEGATKHYIQEGHDPQILTPYRNPEHPLSCLTLNEALQPYFNDHAISEPPVCERFQQNIRIRFYPGDRIICTRNISEKELVNGESLIVIDGNQRGRSRKLTVKKESDGETLELENSDITHLELAYALTIHKSQGSEYPTVILPVYGNVRGLLRRSVYYTAITRAKTHLVLIGQKHMLDMAATSSSYERQTRLKYFLQKESA